MRAEPFLHLLLLLGACGGHPDSGPAPEPLAAGQLRVTQLDDLGSDVGWAGDWLDTEGWTLWGYRVETGSPGRVQLKWTDPRRRTPFADVAFELQGAKSARLVFAVRIRPLLLGPIPVSCESCGASFRIQGSILDTKQECPRCHAPLDLAPEWNASPTREFRLLVVGDAQQVTGERPLRRSGNDLSGSPDRTVLFAGSIPTPCVLTPEKAFDLYARHDAVDLEAGSHRLARLLDPGETSHRSMSRNSSGEQFDFDAASERVRVHATESSCEIVVDGTNVTLEDYPFAVWDLDLAWTPK